MRRGPSHVAKHSLETWRPYYCSSGEWPEARHHQAQAEAVPYPRVGALLPWRVPVKQGLTMTVNVTPNQKYRLTLLDRVATDVHPRPRRDANPVFADRSASTCCSTKRWCAPAMATSSLLTAPTPKAVVMRSSTVAPPAFTPPTLSRAKGEEQGVPGGGGPAPVELTGSNNEDLGAPVLDWRSRLPQLVGVPRRASGPRAVALHP